MTTPPTPHLDTPTAPRPVRLRGLCPPRAGRRLLSVPELARVVATWRRLAAASMPTRRRVRS